MEEVLVGDAATTEVVEVGVAQARLQVLFVAEVDHRLGEVWVGDVATTEVVGVAQARRLSVVEVDHRVEEV